MAEFDAAAKDYDDHFTYSQIGIYQRNQVWSYLEKVLPKRPLSILELNGGTGEDALWLAKKGHRVTCTDASQDMLTNAETKIKSSAYGHLVEFQTLDFNRAENFKPSYQYDLIFSNFAGLNCIDREGIQSISNHASNWLLPGGELIWVMLGKYCVWEWLYFFFKGELKKAERRWTSESVVVEVNGEAVHTWYYSPAELFQLIGDNFEKVSSKAIGTFVPPSYLNPRFKKGSGVLKTLNIFDEDLGSNSLFTDVSDHYLIHLRKR